MAGAASAGLVFVAALVGNQPDHTGSVGTSLHLESSRDFCLVAFLDLAVGHAGSIVVIANFSFDKSHQRSCALVVVRQRSSFPMKPAPYATPMAAAPIAPNAQPIAFQQVVAE